MVVTWCSIVLASTTTVLLYRADSYNFKCYIPTYQGKILVFQNSKSIVMRLPDSLRDRVRSSEGRS